ncbi:hypothetical protein ACK1KB_09460 [Chryseobacterium sp. TY3]
MAPFPAVTSRCDAPDQWPTPAARAPTGRSIRGATTTPNFRFGFVGIVDFRFTIYASSLMMCSGVTPIQSPIS